MKFILLIIIHVFLSKSIFCQNIDSNYVKKLLIRAELNIIINPKQSLTILDSIDVLLNNTKYYDFITKSKIYRGNAYKNILDFESAEKYYDDAKKYLKHQFSKENYISILSNQANNFSYLKKYSEAIKMSDEVINSCNTSSTFDLNAKGLAYYTKGYICVQTGDSLGIYYLKKSEDFHIKSNNINALGITYYYLARLYKKINNNEKVRYYGEESLKYLHKTNQNRVAVINLLAQAYQFNGESKKAIDLIINVINDTMISKRGRLFLQNSLGIIFKEEERYEEAKSVLKDGIVLANELKLNQKKAEILANLGGIEFDQNNFEEAKNYYNLSKEIYFDEKNNFEWNDKLLILEMLIKSNLANHKDYIHFNRYFDVRDSLERENNNKSLIQYLTKYETEKKSSEILKLKNLNLLKDLNYFKLEDKNSKLEKDYLNEALKTLQNKKLADSLDNIVHQNLLINKELAINQKYKESIISSQKNFLNISFLSLFFITIISYFLYHQSQKRKKLNITLSEQKDKIKVLNRELNHRVKNNLAFMTSLLEMQGRRTESNDARHALKETESRLNALALVHNQLFKSESDTDVNLKKYLLEVTSHLKIIFITKENIINFNTDYIDFQINAEDAMRIGLIVNELVTNSIKHAFSTIEYPEINIQTFLDNDGKLSLKYNDNGVKINGENLQKIDNNSLGMKLIQLLKQQLGDNYVVIV